MRFWKGGGRGRGHGIKKYFKLIYIYIQCWGVVQMGSRSCCILEGWGGRWGSANGIIKS